MSKWLPGKHNTILYLSVYLLSHGDEIHRHSGCTQFLHYSSCPLCLMVSINISEAFFEDHLKLSNACTKVELWLCDDGNMYVQELNPNSFCLLVINTLHIALLLWSDGVHVCMRLMTARVPMSWCATCCLSDHMQYQRAVSPILLFLDIGLSKTTCTYKYTHAIKHMHSNLLTDQGQVPCKSSRQQLYTFLQNKQWL